MEWAALASVVFATVDSDPAARRIVLRAASELARLVHDVQVSLGVEGPVVLAGGLILNQPSLELAVREELALPCMRLEHPPVEGAIRMAEELLR